MKKAAATRKAILEKAFELIYAKGYQATSVDDILATTQVTKGAFYYHFRNKEEMAKAIIAEIIKPTMASAFIEPLQNQGNPLENIYNLISGLLLENEFLQFQYGCPTSNLIQELSPWNAALSQTLHDLVDTWQKALIAALQNGIENGTVNKKAVPEQVAFFTMSGYWGIRNFGKAYNTDKHYLPYLKELKSYLQSLQ